MSTYFTRRSPWGQWDRQERVFRLPIDVYETERDIVVLAALPGLEPQDVDITLERGVLTIRAEFKPPLGNVRYWLNEIPYGLFQRALRLDAPIDSDEITATFERGILTITLPKAPSAHTKTIPVHVARD